MATKSNTRLLGQGFSALSGNTRLLGQGLSQQKEPKSYADTLQNRIDNYETRFGAIGQEPPEEEKKQSLLLKTLDIIDRPRNAIVNAIQDTSTGENGVWQGLKEGFTGKEHAYVSDLLPEDMNKYAKGGLGFIGDVLLDPLTYLTVGAGGVVKGAATGGAKAVAKGGGKKMLKFAGQEIAGSEKIIDPIAKWTGRVLDATGIPDAIGTALQPGYIAGKASKTVDQIKDIGKAQDLTRFSQQRAKGQVDSFVNAGDINKVKNIPVETRELITDILEMPTQQKQAKQGIINKPGFRRSFPESDMTRRELTEGAELSARPPFRESDSINAFKSLTPQGDLRQATNEGIGRLGKVIDEAKLPEQTGLFADDIKVKNSRGQTISAAKLASLDDNVVQLKSQLDEMVDNQLTKLNQEWDVTGKHSKDGGQRAFSGWDEGFNMQASLTKGLQSKFGGKANQSRMKALARESLEKGYKSIDGDILPDEAYLALKKQYDEAHKVAFDTAKERVSAAKKANKQGRNQLLKSLEADYASKIKPKPKALDQGALFEYEKALPKIRNSMSQVFKSIDAGDFDAIDQTLIKEIADALPDKQASEFMEAVTKGIKDGKVSKDAKGKLYKDAYVASKFGKEQASLKQIINIAESKLGRELTEQEIEGIELITKMRAETMLKDIKAGVEFDPLPNYIRHLYENPPEQIRELKNEYVKRIAALNPKGGFQKQRSFDTIKDFEDFAREQGVELIAKKDAGLLTVVREMEGISQRVVERTYKQILNMGDNVVQDAATAPTDWVKLPIKGFEGKAIEPNVAREITRSHQIFSSEEGINGLFKTLDTVQNIWKGLVTTSVPFHIRNSMGNAYNNFLAGVVNPNLYPMAWAIQNDSTGKWVLNGAEYTGNEIMDLFRQQGLEGFGIFKGESINTKIKQTEDVLGVNKPGFNLANPISADFAPVKGSRWLGDKIETNAKLAHFIDKITKGYSPEEAAQSVRKYLFDYADLTPTEEKIKKVIPFYTWTRKNIPLQIESLITQPGKPTAVSKLVQNMRNTQGTEDSDMPDWMNDEMAIPIYVNDEGNQVYLMPDLPIANLNMFGGGETMRNMMGMLTPLAKVPMEIGMNQQIFTGAPIEQYEGAQSQIGGVSMPSKAVYALNQLGSMPRSALTMAGNFTQQQPTGDSLIPPAPTQGILENLLLGGLSRQVNPERQKIFNLMDRDSQLADFRKLLEDVYGIDIPTINEIKKGQ